MATNAESIIALFRSDASSKIDAASDKHNYDEYEYPCLNMTSTRTQHIVAVVIIFIL